MFHHYLSLWYETPTYIYLIGICVCVLAWSALAHFFRDRKLWFKINLIVFILALVAVLFITVFLRSGQEAKITLIPFSVFELAKQYPDVYNQIMLNVVLFVSIGLSLPFVFEKIIKHPVMMTVICSLVFSVVIETLQYVFACGYSEIDDIIFNTTGAFVGTLSYYISYLLRKLTAKRKK